MTHSLKQNLSLPPEQQAIRDKCFHPTGTFVAFQEVEIEQSISDRFETIVAKFADRLAIKSTHCVLTYDQLNKSANRLAHFILARRSDRQAPVALYFEQSVPLIVANLAVLKAGKIALHVNPNSPWSRTARQLEHSEAQMILTDSKNLMSAREWITGSRQLINVDNVDPDNSDENLQLPLSPDDYANLGYTSGSTGHAKGVVKSHRSILRDVFNFTNSCHVCAEDRLTIVGHSVIGKHLLQGLLNGATQYVSEFKTEGLLHLARSLMQDQITIFITLPTVFRHLLSTVPIQNQFSKLRLIRLSGEPLVKQDLELYKKHFSSDCLLVNTYAAQELGDVCHYFIDKSTVIDANRVPVGYPVENSKVIVVDDLGNEVGIDQPGKIVVQSRSLRPVYWKMNDTIYEQFPTIHNVEHQIQITDDLGRISEHGCLMHLGRQDTIVKIRGLRVDVGEVEATLAGHPGVKQAAVVTRETSLGDTIVAAYVVPHSHQVPSVSDLRRFLHQRLPDFMVPTVFSLLSELPLTATGRVDRRVLPNPPERRPNLNTPFVEPGTKVEHIITRIWAEILSLEEIGLNDNFFDLGGHSLGAMRVVSQVVKQFQIDMPLKSLFESPTVAEMAAIITQNQAKPASDAELTQMLREVQALTEEEAKNVLAVENEESTKANGHKMTR